MERKRILSRDYKIGNAITEALSCNRTNIIEQIKDSGLKGKCRTDFSTGIKWELAANLPGNNKYVICNADEGEPGTFKSRILLQNHIETLIEGMIIAGYAINSNNGIIYLRAEYRWMLKDLIKKVDKLREKDFLGKNILGKNFDFDIEFRLNAGAYICGEETSLIESLEGKRGEPRNKPPYPTEKGYLDCPTIINNVETFCYVPYIINEGIEEFKKTSNTKLFSVSGDCERADIYEIDLNTKIIDLLGLIGAKDTKSVLIGGTSGIVISEKDFDKPINYKGLPAGSSIIVFNNSRNMRKILKNFMEFFVEESCGHCTPCREGNIKLLEAIEKINKGDSIPDKYIQTLLELAEIMKMSSKCSLGRSSANSFINFYKIEYRDYIYGN
ncbi:MAG: hypothetical protein A2287_10520 [Candidatus Melainabacteria bacterium RIFOXYA12_FULL_32_12]|nr:MAG: hypothetical protein A2287_10520 [Candidatus Melainabacteria bacterium RIFOXYA12_FULL_32_12]